MDDAGERVGDCTISCRNDGSNGAGVEGYPRPEVWYIGCSWKFVCERDRGIFRDTGGNASEDVGRDENPCVLGEDGSER